MAGPLCCVQHAALQTLDQIWERPVPVILSEGSGRRPWMRGWSLWWWRRGHESRLLQAQIHRLSAATFPFDAMPLECHSIFEYICSFRLFWNRDVCILSLRQNYLKVIINFYHWPPKQWNQSTRVVRIYLNQCMILFIYLFIFYLLRESSF